MSEESDDAEERTSETQGQYGGTENQQPETTITDEGDDEESEERDDGDA